MKPITWVGNSKAAIQSFSEEARSQAGYQLCRVQMGKEPKDWKPMPSIGIGANEIRVHAGSEYRVIYVAKFPEAVFVLHAFGKKTQQTAQHDIDVAKRRYREMMNARREK